MSTGATTDQEHPWTLDKRIPIALIIAILIQSGGAIWWASSIASRVSNLEIKLAEASDQRDRIIRLEERSIHQTAILERIERKIEKVQP